MIVIDNGDAIRGIAEIIEKLDFTVNGYVGTTATQLADGQLSNAEADLYASGADATVVTSITVVNTDSVARTFTLFLKPSGGTSRAISPVSLDLPAYYSFYTDGQRAVVMSTGGEVVQTYSLHAASHTDGTDDIQESSTSQKGICQLDDTPTNGEVNEPITSNWAYDHKEALDAHNYNIYSQLRTGTYISSPFFFASTGTPATIATDRLYAIPFPVVRPMTLDALQTYITTLAAGKVGRLGLYAPGNNLAPGALVIDGGEISVATTGAKTVVINEALTTLGIYWIAFVSDGTPNIYRCTRYIDLLGWSSNIAQGRAGWYVAHTYGALPDPFGTPTSTMDCWKLGLKINSLD